MEISGGNLSAGILKDTWDDKLYQTGEKIYNTKNTSETRRMLVFIVRCLLNTGRMNRLHRFFMKDDVRRRIAAEYPFVYEQPTRAFFYNQSTFDERARLVEQHMEYLEST